MTGYRQEGQRRQPLGNPLRYIVTKTKFDLTLTGPSYTTLTVSPQPVPWSTFAKLP
jgi:hypothetical protein